MRLALTGAGWAWVHVGGAFPCRGDGGLFLDTYAEPAPPLAGTGQRSHADCRRPYRALAS